MMWIAVVGFLFAMASALSVLAAARISGGISQGRGE